MTRPLDAQVRMLAPQVTGFDEGSGLVEAVAVTYNVTDTWNTRFLPGCFNDCLRKETVPLVWSHNHNRRIGKIVDYKDEPGRLVIVAQLDDPDQVPPERADWIRKAWRGLRNRVLDEFSVMIVNARKRTAADGAQEFVTARMMHLGLVMEGAVPGAVLLGTRAAPVAPTAPLLPASLAATLEPEAPSPPAPEIAYYARMDAAYRAAGLDPTRGEDPHAAELAEADALLAEMDARMRSYDTAAAEWEIGELARSLAEQQAVEKWSPLTPRPGA